MPCVRSSSSSVSLSLLVRRRVVERARGEDDPAGELGPDLAEVGRRRSWPASSRTRRAGRRRSSRGGRSRRSRIPEAGSRPGQLVERRDELAMGQVAGRAEEHDGARLGDPGPGQGLPQRVGLGRARRIRHRQSSRPRLRHRGKTLRAHATSKQMISRRVRFYGSSPSAIKGSFLVLSCICLANEAFASTHDGRSGVPNRREAPSLVARPDTRHGSGRARGRSARASPRAGGGATRSWTGPPPPRR